MAQLLTNFVGSGLTIPQVNSLWTVDHIATPYDYFKVKRRYIWLNGTTLLPVTIQSQQDNYPLEQPPPAGSRVASAICRTHSAVGWYVISWAAQRTGAEPIVPSPQQLLPMGQSGSFKNNILAYADNEVESPELQSDGGTNVYRCSGTYIYLLIQPVWGPLDGLFEGLTPYSLSPPSTFPAGNFNSNL